MALFDEARELKVESENILTESSLISLHLNVTRDAASRQSRHVTQAEQKIPNNYDYKMNNCLILQQIIVDPLSTTSVYLQYNWFILATSLLNSTSRLFNPFTN